MKNLIIMLSLSTVFASCSCQTRTDTYPNRTYNDRDCTDANRDCVDDRTQDSDWQTTTRVKSSLMSDGSVSASGRFISVETNNGVVTLTGNVPSREESNYIERKVKSIKGVRGVDNQLVIKP